MRSIAQAASRADDDRPAVDSIRPARGPAVTGRSSGRPAPSPAAITVGAAFHPWQGCATRLHAPALGAGSLPGTRPSRVHRCAGLLAIVLAYASLLGAWPRAALAQAGAIDAARVHDRTIPGATRIASERGARISVAPQADPAAQQALDLQAKAARDALADLGYTLDGPAAVTLDIDRPTLSPGTLLVLRITDAKGRQREVRMSGIASGPTAPMRWDDPTEQGVARVLQQVVLRAAPAKPNPKTAHAQACRRAAPDIAPAAPIRTGVIIDHDLSSRPFDILSRLGEGWDSVETNVSALDFRLRSQFDPPFSPDGVLTPLVDADGWWRFSIAPSRDSRCARFEFYVRREKVGGLDSLSGARRFMTGEDGGRLWCLAAERIDQPSAAYETRRTVTVRAATADQQVASIVETVSANPLQAQGGELLARRTVILRGPPRRGTVEPASVDCRGLESAAPARLAGPNGPLAPQ